MLEATRVDVDNATDWLLAALDDGVADERMMVATLEAPTGWGKSTVVDYFYGELARERDESGFWPGQLSGDRKQLFPPEVNPKRGAVMPYLWWGLRGQTDLVGGEMVACAAALDAEYQLTQLAHTIADALSRWDRRWSTRLRTALTVSGLVLPTLGQLPSLVERALEAKDKFDQLAAWREAAGQLRDTFVTTDEALSPDAPIRIAVELC